MGIPTAILDPQRTFGKARTFPEPSPGWPSLQSISISASEYEFTIDMVLGKTLKRKKRK